MQISAPTPPPVTTTHVPPTDPLLQKARALEAAFLAEMLGYGGLGTTSSAFSGGIGEDQFASFLRQEQARLVVARGGIGLAEAIYRAMGGTDDI